MLAMTLLLQWYMKRGKIAAALDRVVECQQRLLGEPLELRFGGKGKRDRFQHLGRADLHAVRRSRRDREDIVHQYSSASVGARKPVETVPRMAIMSLKS